MMSQSANVTSKASIGSQMGQASALGRKPASYTGKAITRTTEASTPSQARAAGKLRARRNR